MALYEITQDCRIANKEYQKGDVISDIEVGGFYPSVMKPTKMQPKPTVKKEPEKVIEEPVEEEINDEVEEVVEKKIEVKKSKKGKRK